MFNDTLRRWRRLRRLSQLDLALAADVSARHISFLETGRARPSRMMVTHLASVFEVPRADRNHMLAAAGFAPAYGERALSEAEMQPVRNAIQWTLERHNPFPGVVIDRHWTAIEMNQATARLSGAVDVGLGDNLVEALLSPALRRALVNWSELIHHAARRLTTESAALGGDAVLDRYAAQIAAELKGSPTTPPDRFPPFIPAVYRMGDAELRLISTLASFGSAEDVALADLRIELMFPEDDLTRAFLQRMA